MMDWACLNADSKSALWPGRIWRVTASRTIRPFLPQRRADDHRPQCLQRLIRSDEEIARVAAILEHVRVDGAGLVDVQPETGQILQPQIAIAIDRRVLQIRLQIGTTAREGREQLDRGIEANLAQRLGDPRV